MSEYDEHRHSTDSDSSLWSTGVYVRAEEKKIHSVRPSSCASGQPLLSNLPSPSLFKFDSSRKPMLDDGAILNLCDAARSGLRGSLGLDSKVKTVLAFLEAVLADECNPAPTMQISTIIASRLDKLLTDMLDPSTFSSHLLTSYGMDPSTPERLQRRWRSRFRERYFDLDQTRYLSLSDTGRLQGVVFDDNTKSDTKIWCVEHRITLPTARGNPHFEAGE